MINVNITNIVAESLAICAIATCGVEDEKPPPTMRTIDDIYAEHGFIQLDHAPYIDERVAELAEYKRNLAEKESELERLRGEIEALKSKQNEAESVDNRQVGAGKTFEATFYTAFCPTGCTGITATGVDVSKSIYHEGKRIIAVDPSVIPLGSHVRVTLADGTSFEATALDVGGDIRGNRIDILVKTREEAYRLGRQKVRVEVY